jgi:hypothetical protein
MRVWRHSESAREYPNSDHWAALSTVLLGLNLYFREGTNTALVVKSNWKDKWDRGRGPLNADAAMLEKFSHIVLSQSKIELLINPPDADH